MDCFICDSAYVRYIFAVRQRWMFKKEDFVYVYLLDTIHLHLTLPRTFRRKYELNLSLSRFLYFAFFCCVLMLTWVWLRFPPLAKANLLHVNFSITFDISSVLWSHKINWCKINTKTDPLLHSTLWHGLWCTYRCKCNRSFVVWFTRWFGCFFWLQLCFIRRSSLLKLYLQLNVVEGHVYELCWR